MSYLLIILTLFSSLALTLFILPRLLHIASRIGLMDFPDNHRKVHAIAIPRVGGLGIVTALLISSILFIPFSNLRGFYVGVMILVLIGFFDDFKELTPRWKFIAQVSASIFMIAFSETFLSTFGNILGLGSVNHGIFTIPVTLFCTVGVINAINMIDGLDGLAGGISLISFISFAILAFINNQYELMLLSIILIGSTFGFLRYNWYPAKLFMGDAGSLTLGFSLAFLSIAIAQKDNTLVPPVVPLLILTVPIVDTVTIMIKRIINGNSPFRADKFHFHHILLRLGYDRKTTVKIILAISSMLSFIAIIGTVLKIPDYYLFLVFLFYFIPYFSASFYLKEIVKWRKKRINGRARIEINPTHKKSR